MIIDQPDIDAPIPATVRQNNQDLQDQDERSVVKENNIFQVIMKGSHGAKTGIDGEAALGTERSFVPIHFGAAAVYFGLAAIFFGLAALGRGEPNEERSAKDIVAQATVRPPARGLDTRKDLST